MNGHESESSQGFVTRLTASQQSLYAFIFSLLPNASDAGKG
jgi:hypothetical protein